MQNFGPQTPDTSFMDYTNFPTKNYVRGHAAKIIYDLNKIARLYNGKKFKVFTDGSTDVCPYCVDKITGAITVSNCPVCKGTGSSERELLIECWGFVDFGPLSHTPTELGNTENTGGQRDTFTLITSKKISDQCLVVPIDTKEVFKVINTEPLLVAMQGTIVTQVVHCSRMSYGAPEYSVVTW